MPVENSSPPKGLPFLTRTPRAQLRNLDRPKEKVHPENYLVNLYLRPGLRNVGRGLGGDTND